MANGYEYCISSSSSVIGFALETIEKLPINGLRHLPIVETNGWYIWCGEEYLARQDFFLPLHTSHMEIYCPKIIKLLGLPPGFRFLLADNYLDIWFDASLLIA